MPSKSAKQARTMAAAAHNPAFAKKVGIPVSVGKDFNQADKGRKFKEGGFMKPVDSEENPGLSKLPTEVRNKMGYMKKGGKVKHDDIKQDMPMMKKVAKQEVKAHEKSMHKMAKGGSASARADGCATKGKTKGTMIAMRSGGSC
jgi:hypothetical protein